MSRAICLSGANRNTTCIAAVLICVINTVLYITLDALDMLRGIALTFVIKLFIFHLLFSCDNYLPVVGKVIIS